VPDSNAARRGKDLRSAAAGSLRQPGLILVAPEASLERQTEINIGHTWPLDPGHGRLLNCCCLRSTNCRRFPDRLSLGPSGLAMNGSHPTWFGTKEAATARGRRRMKDDAPRRHWRKRERLALIPAEVR